MTTSHEDELMLFAEESLDSVDNKETASWKIAIVDDDEDVHHSTEFALKGVIVNHRPLQLIHAYSKAQAREVFKDLNDVAVVLLDVVMETEQAGLELVSFIRDELGWTDTRIILRTGQPGYAPEEDAIRDYDINDYKTKNELTRKKLLTSLTSAIRSYEQIRTIDASRRGLHQIIRSSAAFTFEHGIHSFAAGVLTQIAALCGIPPEGLLCAEADYQDDSKDTPAFNVIASAGHYSNLMNCPIDHIHNNHIRESLRWVLTHKEALYSPGSMTLYFAGRGKRPLAAYIDLPTALSEINQNLLEVFCANLDVCLDNLHLVSQLKNHAYRDQLLKMPNRLHCIEQLSKVIAENPQPSMLVLIDIDDFAEINDVLGHHYGDLLLKAVADRLRQELGQEIFIARISGDVFGLLGAEAQLQPEIVRRLFSEAFDIENTSHSVSVSMGMVLLADYQGDGAEPLKDASIALKRTKLLHRGSYTLFTRSMGVEIRERATLMQHLHKAFDTERLFLMYQPQVDLYDGHVVGLEALIRWRRDDGSMIPPNEFIPLAEYSGLIVSLGAWVLRTACHMMKGLQKSGVAPERIGVNVSAVQFRQDDFIDIVRQALHDSGLQPGHLELEITESVTMHGSAMLESKLHELKELGVKIAIDDFGTGFSSLSYLDKLPADRLKIDRAFVNQIDTPEGPRIAELITGLGSKLGLSVIAEGIEHAHHWTCLRAMGCDEGQGYFIARPMAEEDLHAWLSEYRSPVAKLTECKSSDAA